MKQKTALLLLLLALPILNIPAQAAKTNTVPSILESENIPQWVKDLRRWEIVAFGSIPFTMLTATFAMDMYRWNDANGMDFSEEGRRYAPWPLKSAGAVLMQDKEQETVFIIAGSLSLAIALADQLIVQIKRHNARKRAESLPVGSTIITRKPMSEETDGEQDGAGGALSPEEP
ncbi:MAG: hypothetical protein LBG95_08395 [Treponema sp.]|nr:hypothetical protein [Treponema sp.]